MQHRALWLIILPLIMAVSLCACSQTAVQMQDGYYTAEAADFDEYGWKEFITIYVNNNRIVTVEYNAKNASGFIKSWDMEYMRDMNLQDGTYPNAYARGYAAMLLNKQKVSGVDAISGATHSYATFKQLAEAVIEKARDGDKSVAFVEFQGKE